MKTISITRHGLSTLCRLCLSSGVNMIDIFWFSNRLKLQLAEVIMECAPIQITRCDGMPNVICRLCYTQLEKIYRFQKQVVQSEKTLRKYVQQLDASDNETKPDCSIQKPSENALTHNINSNVFVKCESFELDDEFDMDATWQETEPTNSKNKTETEMSIKSEIKVEHIDDDLLIPIECTDDTAAGTSYNMGDDGEITCEDPKINIGSNEFSENLNNWKETELENFNSPNTSNEEIKNESIDVKSLIPIVYIDDTVNALRNDNVSSTNSEDKTIDNGHTSETITCYSSPAVTESFDNCNSDNKIRFANHETHKDAIKACDVCGMCFTRLEEFKRHKSLHSGDKLYQCNVCDRQFTQSSNLYRHRRVHTGERPYQCDVCKKRFSQSGSLNNHKLTHTGEKPHQCEVCNKRFNHLSHLIVHKRTHTGEKPYPCDICDKHFAQLSTLNDHRLTHTGEKPYHCDVCNNNFTKLSSLNIHKRTHTGEKPYQCDFCNKRFYHSSHLNSHKRTHTGEKPHHCDICEKSFKESATLKKHRRIHTGEKPHQCNLCNKIFNKSDISNHKCTDTGEKPYQCSVCDKSFTQIRHLNTHKLSHS